LKQVGGGDSLGDFIFKDGDEAWSADAGVVFGSQDLCAVGVTYLALARRHGEIRNKVLSCSHEVVNELKVEARMIRSSYRGPKNDSSQDLID
jgi:hypothetical protein